MESKLGRNILLAFLALVFIAGSFSGGVLVGWILPKPSTTTIEVARPTDASATAEANLSPLNQDKLFAPFWQAWDLVHNQYVDQPVDDTKLMQGAIQGMLSSLGDPHTSYLPPTEMSQLNMQLQGEYEGIGAWVDTTQEYLTIISPMEGSPAQKAGLKAGDQIIAIDGVDKTGIDPNIVLQSVLGKADTVVTLTIKREGIEKPFDVQVTRGKIVMPSVVGKMLDNNIAYIQLTTFGDTTSADLRKQLTELLAKNPKGLILDLRNNGGGYLNTAIEVVSEFISNGVVMYEEHGDGSRDTFTALPGGLATKIPLVVLVNKGTASASEITAGAIQDYGRGQLVGEKTYGKGSVQNLNNLDNNQGAVRITIARWLTPKERQIDKIGLTPDVVVELTEADITAGKDPQLEKAIELLSQ